MNRYGLDFLSFRRWASILGGLSLIVFGGFYFFNVSAQTEAVENPAEQNLVNGRLAFSTISFPQGQGGVATANPDGSGQMFLPITTSPQPKEPAWSPDATKIAFSSIQLSADIYVINSDGSGQTNLTNTPSDIQEGNPSWSVTGKIAYHRNPQTTTSQIWVMNADGSGQAQFSGITQPFPFAPAWSPDGMKLAFVSGGEIWVINADGTNERRVTMNTSTDTDPAWSPDGSKIVFAKGGSGISVINADGTNETPLTSVSGDSQPAWSPDGTKIAFRRGSGTRGLYTMDVNGGNQVRILADIIQFPLCCDTIYENPAWQPVAQTPNTYVINGRVTYNNLPVSGATVNLSGTINASTTTDAIGNYQFSGLPAGGSYTISPSLPNHYFLPPSRSFNNLDGNKIADFTVSRVCFGLICVRNGKIAFVRNGDIFTMNADGSNQTNITNNAAVDSEPNYSPDGSKIIFSTNRDGNHEIYRMDADGSNPVRLTNNTTSDFSPDYSPDGASIVFVSARDGNNEIYKMNADGSNQIRLTNDAAHQGAPSFSPDGQKIVFVVQTVQSPMMLFTMNADGTNQQTISTVGGFYSRPSYSPDGSKIIFVYGGDVTQQTIWTMNADGTNRQQFPEGRSSPTYSPDGTKVARACCFLQGGSFPNGIFSTNSDGSSSQRLTSNNDDMPAWQPIPVARRTPYDFDGDGRADVSVFRPSNGFWYRFNSSNNSFFAIQFGQAGDKPAPADYDGDGKTDIAVFREGAFGYFYILNSSDNTFRFAQFGTTGDLPVVGDWDGDAAADLAVYRGGNTIGSQSNFYYRPSSVPNIDYRTITNGTGGRPVVGDFDGDGRVDAALVLPSAVWSILRSSDNQLTQTAFGVPSDIPVPADFDGDGKTNIAVYRPTSGTWYTSQNAANNYGAIQFGANGDVPVPADYDGDGRADAAVFRPSNGAWYLNRTTSGFTGVQFGTSEDKPTPSAFVY